MDSGQVCATPKAVTWNKQRSTAAPADPEAGPFKCWQFRTAPEAQVVQRQAAGAPHRGMAAPLQPLELRPRACQRHVASSHIAHIKCQDLCCQLRTLGTMRQIAGSNCASIY